MPQLEDLFNDEDSEARGDMVGGRDSMPVLFEDEDMVEVPCPINAIQKRKRGEDASESGAQQMKLVLVEEGSSVGSN